MHLVDCSNAVAADGVEHDVGPAAAGLGLHRPPTMSCVDRVDDDVGAGLPRDLRLRGAADDADHARTRGRAELHRRACRRRRPRRARAASRPAAAPPGGAGRTRRSGTPIVSAAASTSSSAAGAGNTSRSSSTAQLGEHADPRPDHAVADRDARRRPSPSRDDLAAQLDARGEGQLAAAPGTRRGPAARRGSSPRPRARAPAPARARASDRARSASSSDLGGLAVAGTTLPGAHRGSGLRIADEEQVGQLLGEERLVLGTLGGVPVRQVVHVAEEVGDQHGARDVGPVEALLLAALDEARELVVVLRDGGA